MKLYFDGVLRDTQTFGPFAVAVGSPHTVKHQFGASVGVAGTEFPGTVDEVTWHDSVLTAANITAMYAAGNSLGSEVSGARVGTLLDLAGWPAASRDISTGASVLENVAIDRRKLLSVLREAEVAEQGQLWVAANGDITFVDRATMLANTTVAGTFGDTATSGQQAIMETREDGERQIINQSTVNLGDGETSVSTDATSVTRYGRKAESLTTTTADPLIAEHRTGMFKDPLPRFPSLTVKPGKDDALWPETLGAEIGDLFALSRTPQGVGSAITDTLAVEGIHHSFTTNNWVTRFDMGPAFSEQWFKLNSSELDSTKRLRW